MEQKEVEKLIKENMGFIIQTVSQTTGRYVNVQNDDAFSVALLAFDEACQKYEEGRGSFLAFVKTVIKSRVIDHLRRENRHQHLSTESLTEEGVQFSDPAAEITEQSDLADDMDYWKKELEDFSISMTKLADEAPKHQDTRERAINIGEKSSKHEPITGPLYEKKRLPIKRTAEYNGVTVKVIRGSLTFIIAVIVIFFKDLKALAAWIKGGGQ